MIGVLKTLCKKFDKYCYMLYTRLVYFCQSFDKINMFLFVRFLGYWLGFMQIAKKYDYEKNADNKR